MPKAFRKRAACEGVRATVVDSNVQKGIDAQVYASVQPCGASKGSRGDCFGCSLPLGFLRRIFPGKILGGVIIGVTFHIGCPALHVSAGVNKIADVRRILAGKIYSLVKMPRKAFVGQRGEKLQIADRTAVVDINDVRGACVHRRCQIKSRAEKFLHRFMYRADFKADSRCFREILSGFFPEGDLRWFRVP